MIKLLDRYEYAKSDIIGSGSFGDCYLAFDTKTQKECVLKVSRETENMNRERLQAEAQQLEILVHPHIAHGIEHFFFENEFYIVMDYYENGDLQSYLQSVPPPSIKQICLWLAQLASAINYLHSQRIIHRDLKLQNLFVSKQLDLYVGDFGTVRELLNNGFANTFIGTPQAMSPELINEQPYGLKSDMWSVGCILYEILTKKAPFMSCNFMALMRIISEAKYAPIQDTKLQKEFQHFIDGLLQIDPQKRWGSYRLCQELKTELDELQLSQFIEMDEDHEDFQPTQTEKAVVQHFNALNTMSAPVQHESSVEAIKTRLYEKLLELTNDEDVIYKLIVAHTFMLQKMKVKKILDFLEINLEQKEIDYNNFEVLIQEQEFLIKITNQLCPGKQAGEIAELVRKLSVGTFINE
ncbi:Kinase [Hexamita inflata]|uniref:non-specific serine/threonine protein kinase n=1 Tax=Hexamita inflata TaxID=28002 RepID=A0ABP1H9B2_9EUKA